MEIKGIADLVPYHKSLKELWAREEFQPVLGLLASLRADAVMEVKRANIERPAEDCKAALAMIRIKLNLLDSFTHLPDEIAAAAQLKEHQEQHRDKMVQSQESGGIVKERGIGSYMSNKERGVN